MLNAIIRFSLDNRLFVLCVSLAVVVTGLMAAPNLIALLALSPLVAKLSKEYFERQKRG